MSHDGDVQLALELASEATAIAMTYFGRRIGHEVKTDGSPPTEDPLVGLALAPPVGMIEMWN